MASKADRFYFENFIAAAEESCRAAEYLVECLTNYEPDAIGVMLEKMHAMEHAADKKKHEMSTSLAKAFVTPIDREVVATNGQYYTLRIAPYRTTENSIKGLVITIIDSLETGRARKTQD